MKMTKFFKMPLYLTMGAFMAMGLYACSDENDPGTGGGEGELSEQEQALKNIVTDFANNTAVPTYRGMADAAIELHNACLAMKNAGAGNVTTAQVETAGEAWKKARRYWELSEAWLFGPAGDYNIDPHIDSWPLDKTSMDALLANEEQMSQMDEDGTYVGNNLGFGLQGFHAIEYLLFELQGTGADAKSIAHNVNYTTQELLYMTGVTGDLRNQCVLLEACWAGTENVTAEKQALLEDNELDKGVNYSQVMMNAGQAGSEYVNYLEAVQDLISAGIQNIANEVGNIKIGNPTGLGDPAGGMEEDPGYIESPYSLNSITDFKDNIISIQNAYEGFQSSESYNAGETVIQPSTYTLSAYINSLDADLDERVKKAIDDAYNAISQMKEPFAYWAGRDDAINQAAVDACNTLNDIFFEVDNILSANH